MTKKATAARFQFIRNNHNKDVETRYVPKTKQSTAQSNINVMGDSTTHPIGWNSDDDEELIADEDYVHLHSCYVDNTPGLIESDDDISTSTSSMN